MTTRSFRLTIAAGAAYVAGWITGLLVGPTGPDATAAPAAVQAYYAGEGPAIVLQSLLVHGIPAVALALLSICAIGAFRPVAALRVCLIATAATAAALSLGQVGIAVIAVAVAHASAPGTTAALFHGLNLADTAKLLALAGFAAAAWAAARRRGAAPGWFTALTCALVVLLPFGGAAFLFASPVLSALLIASLPLLMAWVAGLTVVAARRFRHSTDAVSSPAQYIDVAESL
jgi:hypothetical protein